MKIKELTSLRTKKIEELKEMVSKKKLEVDQFLANSKAGSEKNLSKARVLRKEIAQILTIIREQEILGKEKI